MKKWKIRMLTVVVFGLCLIEIALMTMLYNSWTNIKNKETSENWDFIKEAKVPIAVEKALATPEPIPTPKPVLDSYEIELLAHLIYGEAGDQSDDCQLAVGSVVLNRVAHKSYPNSIEEVIFQRGQYACTWDGNFDREPSKQAWDNAKWLLENESILPENVIYQSQFVQGSGVYQQIGTEIFCYE